MLNVTCDRGYYGAQCDRYCVPRDNCTGHLTCNQVTGAVECLPGWTGSNCTVAVTNTSSFCPTSSLYQSPITSMFISLLPNLCAALPAHRPANSLIGCTSHGLPRCLCPFHWQPMPISLLVWVRFLSNQIYLTTIYRSIIPLRFIWSICPGN